MELCAVVFFESVCLGVVEGTCIVAVILIVCVVGAEYMEASGDVGIGDLRNP